MLAQDTVGTNTETEITDGSFYIQNGKLFRPAANPRNHSKPIVTNFRPEV
jgi:hypothetical protein